MQVFKRLERIKKVRIIVKYFRIMFREVDLKYLKAVERKPKKQLNIVF